ncbi:hypothetical protein OG599_26595 [Streptomyces sp. NBC_01335]|uniref:hypothetical protein n=1 Tax=Streptomyces sp. NBC_01335 TaxID=2903828 RepID=UPI002E13333A|nr:hypothetical protein OG599_26595 [Streptomyces sp. NBC_01335]
MKVLFRARTVVVTPALGLGALTAPTAAADPAAGEYRILAGVGSDTTDDVVNALGDTVLIPRSAPPPPPSPPAASAPSAPPAAAPG